jgi:hypothetical protein
MLVARGRRLRRKHRKAIKRYALILAALIVVAVTVDLIISMNESSASGATTSSGAP